MAPHWLSVVSWASLAVAFACALLILVDEYALGNRQRMAIMNVVHPITALYWGPAWLFVYLRLYRKGGRAELDAEAERLTRLGADPDELRRKADSTAAPEVRWWHVAGAVSHCGAGCTLGDIGGEWLLFAIGMPALGIFGTFGWEVVVDFALAWLLGIVFQYFTSGSTGDDGGRLARVWRAIRVDTASILAFQIGMYGWMALTHFVLFEHPLEVDTASHWAMMQVGMVAGFLTAWPVNRLLVRTGVKEKMDYRRHVAMTISRLDDAARAEAS